MNTTTDRDQLDTTTGCPGCDGVDTPHRPECTKARRDGFLVLTPDLTWGWGRHIPDARQAARRAGSRAAAEACLVYQLPAGAEDAWVDQMGQIRWTWATDAPDRDAVGVTVREPRR